MKAVVKQNPEAEVPVEILARSIKEIADGMKRIRTSALNDKALKLLISHSSGVSQRDVHNVLWALDSLSVTYLKKKP